MRGILHCRRDAKIKSLLLPLKLLLQFSSEYRNAQNQDHISQAPYDGYRHMIKFMANGICASSRLCLKKQGCALNFLEQGCDGGYWIEIKSLASTPAKMEMHFHLVSASASGESC